MKRYAEITIFANTTQAARSRAEECFGSYFQGENWALVGEDAEAIIANDGSVFHWSVRLSAEGIDAQPEPHFYRTD